LGSETSNSLASCWYKEVSIELLAILLSLVLKKVLFVFKIERNSLSGEMEGQLLLNVPVVATADDLLDEGEITELEGDPEGAGELLLREADFEA